MIPPVPSHIRTRRLRGAVAALALAAVSGCVSARPPVFETVPPGSEAPFPTSAATATEPTANTSDISAPTRIGRLTANAVVVHIVDGDTVDVVFTPANRRERVRLIGIDTPESKRPNTPIECFAKNASAALGALIPVGTPVFVQPDVELRDQYQRYLGYLYRAADGLFVNLEMARVGMAVPLTFAPNVAHADEFLAAGDAARSAGVGLWSACDGPHEPGTPTTTNG